MRKILNDSIKIIDVINDNNNELPFVISIPHSGLYLTKIMTNKMNDNITLANSDWYLSELYSFLKELGFTVVINNINRYVIDPNRELSFDSKDDYSKSLIYMKTTFLKDIYKISPTEEEINNRIDKFYQKYHNELQKQINKKLKYFDKAFLIDLHSFGKDIGVDIVLGNDNNKTMSKELFNKFKDCFTNNGFIVSDNIPYKGGYIVKKYGTYKNCESIQIEISYKSYIDNRDFIEEELPKINQHLMSDCQEKLKQTFNLIKNIYK